MKYLHILVMALVATVLTACGSGSDGTDNNNAANATPIELNSIQTGSIDENGDDVDVYKINITESGHLLLQLDGPDSMNVDFDLGLYIDDIHSVTVSADEGSDEEIMEYISTPGIYYVAVSAWEGAGSYSLTVAFSSDASVQEL